MAESNKASVPAPPANKGQPSADSSDDDEIGPPIPVDLNMVSEWSKCIVTLTCTLSVYSADIL